MSVSKYKYLSSWMSKYSKSTDGISVESATTEEVALAFNALNDLAEILMSGDKEVLEELSNLRKRDAWLKRHSPKDEDSDTFFDVPQTD